MSFRTMILIPLLACSSGTSIAVTADNLTSSDEALPALEYACAKALHPFSIHADPLDTALTHPESLRGTPLDDEALKALTGTSAQIRAGFEAYDVQLAAVNGAYEGALEFTPSQTGIHDVYIGAPAIPFQLVWEQRPAGRYDDFRQPSPLAPLSTTRIAAPECAELRKAMSYDLFDGQTVRLEFGPTTAVHFVRLYVDVRTAPPPPCGATPLAEQSHVCSPGQDGAQAVPVLALPLGLSDPELAAGPTPRLELDTVYDVQLPRVPGTTTYAGYFEFYEGTDNYELYLGTPSIPVRIQRATVACSRYIPATDCSAFRRGTRIVPVGFPPQGVEIGPSASRHVRVALRHVAAEEHPIKLGAVRRHPMNNRTSMLTVADLDWDRALDLVGADDVLINDGLGTFTSLPVAGLQSSNGAVVDDFNRDGALDIFVPAFSEGLFWGTYLQSSRHIKFVYTPSVWGDIHRNVSQLFAAADFNEDGVLDLVASWAASVPSWGPWLAKADVNFVPGLLTPSPEKSDGFAILTLPGMTVLHEEATTTAQVVAGDFNGDGHQDVIAASTFLSAAKLYLGDGTGTVSFAADIELPGSALAQIAAYDFDRDHHTDLFALHADGTATLSYGRATGFSSPPVFLPTGRPSVYGACEFAFGDFDHEGRADIAVNRGASILVFFAIDGGYELGGQVELPPDISADCIATGDFTGDGFDDLAASVASTTDYGAALVLWPSTP